MVRVVDVAVAAEQAGRIAGEDHFRPVAADQADQVAPQIQCGLQLAIVVAQEDHLCRAKCLTGRPLLIAADLGQLLACHARLVRAGVAIGAQDIGHPAARPDPSCHCAGHGEFGIVRMGDDDHG